MKALDESRIKFVEIANEVQNALNSAFQYVKSNPIMPMAGKGSRFLKEG